jgi:hypothetical protein
MTDRQLQYVIEDGAKRYGLDLKGARVWQFWKRVLYVLELEQLNDEVIPRKTEINRRDLFGRFLTKTAWRKMGPCTSALRELWSILRSLS